MTGLDRPLTRKTNVIDTTRSGFRPLVVRVEGQGVRLRPAGTRTWTPLVPWKAVYVLGIKIRHLEKVAERKARKAQRAAGRG